MLRHAADIDAAAADAAVAAAMPLCQRCRLRDDAYYVTPASAADSGFDL